MNIPVTVEVVVDDWSSGTPVRRPVVLFLELPCEQEIVECALRKLNHEVPVSDMHVMVTGVDRVIPFSRVDDIRHSC